MQAFDLAEEYENIRPHPLKQAIDQVARTDRRLHLSLVNTFYKYYP